MGHDRFHLFCFAPDGGDGGGGDGGGEDPKPDADKGDKGKGAQPDVTALTAQITTLADSLSKMEKELKGVKGAKKTVEDKAAEKETTLVTLQSQLDELQGNLKTAEKKSLIAPFLADAGAHSTADALAFVALDDVEDAESAKAAVEALKESKGYLFKSESKDEEDPGVRGGSPQDEGAPKPATSSWGDFVRGKKGKA